MFYFHCIVLSIIIKNSLQGIIYTPFDSYNNPTINSVYGTGDQLKDITYRSYCAVLCNSEHYSDDNCCVGNTISTMQCQSKAECKKLQDYFQYYIIKIALSSYFILVLITAFVVSIITFNFTKDLLFKRKNAITSFLIVLLASVVIPIVIIEIYCCYNQCDIGSIFGADFNKCGGSNLIQSVEIKNEKRSKRNSKENDTLENKKSDRYIQMDEKIDTSKSNRI